jgi:hypothetical protein
MTASYRTDRPPGRSSRYRGAPLDKTLAEGRAGATSP